MKIIRQLEKKKPNMVRSLSEMREVLYDQKWAKKTPNFNIYYVWRGVKEKNESLKAKTEEKKQ